MNQVIFLASETLGASLKLTAERSFHRVILPNMIEHFLLLVESPRTEAALILRPNVDIVHVIEEIRFHAKPLTADIARELLDLFRRQHLEVVSLFVVLQRYE